MKIKIRLKGNSELTDKWVEQVLPLEYKNDKTDFIEKFVDEILPLTEKYNEDNNEWLKNARHNYRNKLSNSFDYIDIKSLDDLIKLLEDDMNIKLKHHKHGDTETFYGSIKKGGDNRFNAVEIYGGSKDSPNYYVMQNFKNKLLSNGEMDIEVVFRVLEFNEDEIVIRTDRGCAFYTGKPEDYQDKCTRYIDEKDHFLIDKIELVIKKDKD